MPAANNIAHQAPDSAPQTRSISDRERVRQGQVVVVDGVPLPNPASTANLLVGTTMGRWLASHSGVVRGTLLDLGCGNRPFAPWYEALTGRVVAIDPAPGAAQNVQGFAHQLPLADGSVDAVLCTEVLEHVDQLEMAVAEMARVMRPGAHALVTVPFLYPTHEAPYDFHRLTHYGLRSVLERQGLQVVELVAEGGPATLVASWFFRAVRVVIDRLGTAMGIASPLSLKRPFRWFVITPQRIVLALRRNSPARLTALSQLASNGYMALARKPPAGADSA